MTPAFALAPANYDAAPADETVMRKLRPIQDAAIQTLLVHALGGDISRWSDHAPLCDRVLVEVELNGKIATLSREIVCAIKRPMDIFGGDVDAAMQVGITEWRR